MAKVIFLHLSVIHSVHGGGSRTRQTPPRTRQTPSPPGPGRHPPQTRQTPSPTGPGRPPRDQADPPRPGRHPPDQADTPPLQQTPAYGLRAAGTHPTGMHSCSSLKSAMGFAAPEKRYVRICVCFKYFPFSDSDINY